MGVTKYTPQLAEQFTALLAEGKTIEESATAVGVHISTITKWWRKDVSFSAECMRALEVATHLYTDKLRTITETEPDVNRARLHFEIHRWLASKRNAKVYGDRVDVNHTVVDITSALNDASQRALRLPRDSGDIIDAELVVTQQLEDKSATGSKPVVLDPELQELIE